MPARQVHPAAYVDGTLQADEAVTVDAYQLAADDVAGAIAWADAPISYRGADAGLMLVDADSRVIGPVPLGDFLVRRGGRLVHEPADGFWQRHAPAGPAVGEAAVVTPVDI